MSIQSVIDAGVVPWWADGVISGAIWFIGIMTAAIAAGRGASKIDVSETPGRALGTVLATWFCASFVWAFGLFGLGYGAIWFPAKQQQWIENEVKPYIASLPWKTMSADGADIEKDLGENLYEGVVYYKDGRGIRIGLRGVFRGTKSEDGNSELKYKEVPHDLGAESAPENTWPS